MKYTPDDDKTQPDAINRRRHGPVRPRGSTDRHGLNIPVIVNYTSLPNVVVGSDPNDSLCIAVIISVMSSATRPTVIKDENRSVLSATERSI